MSEQSEPKQKLSSGNGKLYEMQAELCRVLGHPRRIQILDLLSTGEKSAGHLLRELGVSKVNLSQHLAVMKHVGLVESRQEGRHMFYRLAFAEIKSACQMIRDVLAAQLNQSTLLARDLSPDNTAGEPEGERKVRRR